MKRYITTTIITLFLALTAVNAQNGLPAMTIHLKDGSKVTKVLRETPDMEFCGMNNVQDDDYVICEVEASKENVGEMTVACQITPTALEKKEIVRFGLIISEDSLDGMDFNKSSLTNISSNNERIYFKDYYAKATKINSSSVKVNEVVFDQHMFAYKITGLRDNTKYYVRAVLGSFENYYSTTKDVFLLGAPKGTYLAPGKYLALGNLDDFIAENEALFGENTDAVRQLLEKYLIRLLRNGDFEAELALAGSVADNIYGKDYFFSYLPHADEVIEMIKADEVKDMYVKATPWSLAPMTTSTSEFGTNGVKEGGAVMVQCDSSWGVTDNEYLLLQPSTPAGRPNPAFCLNGIMFPGKTYNVTITLAPQTDETDTANKPYYFNVYLLEGYGTDLYNDTYPRLGSSAKVVNPTDPEGRSTEFVAETDKLTTFTMPFTPRKLVYCHGIQLVHTKTFASSSSRNKYCQCPRIVGISVTE